jgi:metallo-beta-lactamase class B
VTAHFTPGHTMGSTSWTWTACDKALGCRAIAFMASLSPVAQDGWRFSDPAHARVVAAYRGSFTKPRPCPATFSSPATPNIRAATTRWPPH